MSTHTPEGRFVYGGLRPDLDLPGADLVLPKSIYESADGQLWQARFARQDGLGRVWKPVKGVSAKRKRQLNRLIIVALGFTLLAPLVVHMARFSFGFVNPEVAACALGIAGVVAAIAVMQVTENEVVVARADSPDTDEPTPGGPVDS